MKHKATDYTAIVRPVDEDGQRYFEATFREFRRSLVAVGDSPELALEALFDEADEFFADCKSTKTPLPAPMPMEAWENFSGKVTIRMPKSLHYKLHVVAEDEECSLNYLMISILTWGAEYKHCQVRPVVPTQHFDQRQQLINLSIDPGSGNLATIESGLSSLGFGRIQSPTRQPAFLRLGR